jgi:amidase
MESENELAFCDATEIARRLRCGDVSAEACLAYFLDRVARLDARLHAVVVLDEARARADAREADRRRAAGEPLGPLHGVPMTVKEAFDVEGLPTTFGIPAFEGGRAAADAAIVSRLRAAGAVIFGKTNVPLGLVDFQSYNALYGTTCNPWDLGRGPGGSSGGESAALAAGLTALGYGSDIGGSLRNPAHYTGTFAHKPTFGIVSHEGHSPVRALARQDVGVYGPMARSARDLRLALEITAGPSGDTATAWKLALPRLSKPLSALRVAIWADDPLAPVQAEIASRCRALGEHLARLGATVSEVARPAIDSERAHSCYVKLLSAGLLVAQPAAAFDRVRRTAAVFAPDDDSKAARRAWDGVMPHRTWLRLEEERTALRAEWHRFFETWDTVVAPIGCTTAFPHDHRPFEARTLDVDGVERGYFKQLFWAGLASGAYLPSTAIPTGPSAAGLPIGVQMIGAAYHDLFTIDVAMQLERHGYAFQAPPGYV